MTIRFTKYLLRRFADIFPSVGYGFRLHGGFHKEGGKNPPGRIDV
jgi:hypothetical protein